MALDEPVEELKQKGKQLKVKSEKAAREAASQPWVSGFTRLGYGARGVLYLLMGLLAAQVAVGGPGAPEDPQGAIAAIAAEPLVRVFLIVIAAGLGGYALWSLIRALLDPYQKGSGVEGIVSRLGQGISAISHVALLFYALQKITGVGGAGEGSAADPEEVSASLLTTPWGPWAIGVVGLGLLGVGVSHIYRGWRGDFDEQLDDYALSQRQIRWVERLGRLGAAARGVVFALVGLFFLQAALFVDPGKIKDMDGALQALSRQPYGLVYLGAIALGLLSYGAYSLVGAAWFRIKLA
jgi:hypothetical protein